VGDFHFNLSMPASTVLTVDQYLNPDFGILGTVQYMQWSVINVLNLQNVAIVRGGVPIVLPLSQIFYNLRDTWRFQLGAHYAPTKKFTIRAAAAYDQDPNNPFFQLTPGTNIILNTNAAYRFNDAFGIELGYGHVFYTNQVVNIHAAANTLMGRTSGGRNAYIAKFFFNFN
jgi:long-chain fatty acid transport protein